MNKEKKLEILVKSHQQHFKLFVKEVHHNKILMDSHCHHLAHPGQHLMSTAIKNQKIITKIIITVTVKLSRRSCIIRVLSL